MALVYLITASDFGDYKTLSAALPADKLNAFIQEAQFSDLRKLLGDQFYRDVLDNVATPSYAPLLNGTDFDNASITKHHFGLKTVLIHFAYSRLIMRGDVVSMPFGFVRKNNPDNTSVSITPAERRDIRDENIRLANDHFGLVREYLDLNVATFPKWITGNVPFMNAHQNYPSSSKFSNL